MDEPISHPIDLGKGNRLIALNKVWPRYDQVVGGFPDYVNVFG
jgi:hypothetical protein